MRRCRQRFVVIALCLLASIEGSSADTVTLNILSADDEAEQEFSIGHDPGLVRHGSSDLELGVEGAEDYSRPADVFQRVALRYQNVGIPPGSTITDARLQFMADDEIDKTIFLLNDPDLGIVDILDISLSVYGYLDPTSPANAPPLPGVCPACWALTDMTGGSSEPFTGVGSSITNVTAPVHWDDIPTWTQGPPDYLVNPGAAGPDQQTPNLASIVQEIVDLPAWGAGNAMTIIVDPKVVENDPETGDVFSRGNRTAVAFACGPSPNRCIDFPVEPTAPVLTIEFSPPSNGLEGDFDNDNDADGDDFIEWQLGESPNPLSAQDLLAWQMSYGSAVAAVGEARVVPEPVALIPALWAATAATTLIRRQKH